MPEISKTRKIVFYPGSEESYERYVGYKVRVIDTHRTDKGVASDELDDEKSELRDLLFREGVEALVDCQHIVFNNFHGVRNSVKYGLPVARK